MQLSFLVAAGALVGWVCGQSGSSVGENGLLVHSDAGSFRGLNVSGGGVRQWVGIRFGKSTNGTRRFRPPVRAATIPRGTVFNATTPADACPQNRGLAFTGFQLFANLTGTDGEDCLALNIWAPSMDRLNGSKGAAVAAWMFGGAYTFGSAVIPQYNGSNFVGTQNDTIVVTIGYRTNIFGFPTSAAGDALSPTQLNPGLQDQRLAVEWLYNHIAAFGGDPERITIFGESAGASSVGLWPYAYKQDPIVKGLIMESGTEFLLSALSKDPAANNTGYQVIASQVGCGYNGTSTSSAAAGSYPTPSGRASVEQLRCMQALNFTTIQAAVSNYSGSTNAFQPTIDNITVFSQAAYARMSDAGEFARIPTLVGNNNNEGSILVALSPGVAPDVITNLSFTCPSARVATARYNYSVPVWQYRYFGVFAEQLKALGAFHSSEIPLVFGTLAASGLNASNSTLQQTSAAMQGGWAAFIRDPARGLTQYGWPLYDPSNNASTLIRIAYENALPPVSFAPSQTYNTGVCPSLTVDRSANAGYAAVQDSQNGVDFGFLGAPGYNASYASGTVVVPSTSAAARFRGRYDRYVKGKYRA
ncbi:hypothetical protein PYCC9005_003106 [Savitreella phatthalungensis]